MQDLKIYFKYVYAKRKLHYLVSKKPGLSIENFAMVTVVLIHINVMVCFLGWDFFLIWNILNWKRNNFIPFLKYVLMALFQDLENYLAILRFPPIWSKIADENPIEENGG